LLGFFVFFKKKLASGNINMLKRKEKFLYQRKEKVLCQGKGIPGNFFEKIGLNPCYLRLKALY
jgi:hypothetical protein